MHLYGGVRYVAAQKAEKSLLFSVTNKAGLHFPIMAVLFSGVCLVCRFVPAFF